MSVIVVIRISDSGPSEVIDVFEHWELAKTFIKRQPFPSEYLASEHQLIQRSA